MIRGLFYGAMATAILLIVLVFLLRIVGRHGGPVGAAVESNAANLTGLNL